MVSLKIAIITGSRDWSEILAISNVLDQESPDILISGGARGADKIGESWAQMRGVPYLVAPALWGVLGKKAGNERNRFMLSIANLIQAGLRNITQDSFHEIVVVAAPLAQSRGTRNMLDECAKLGWKVRLCPGSWS